MRIAPSLLIWFATWLAASGAAAQPAGKPPGKPMAMPVRIAPVKQGPVSVEVTAVGTLIANESVVIRPEIAGRVTAIHFAEGQTVAAGAKLVSIDAAEVQAQIAATEAELTLNRQRHERAVDLHAKNFISAQALDEARSNLARSTAKLAEDRARLRKSEIVAPFGGTLGLRQISPGAYVRAGDDIVRLEDISQVKLDFRLPETYLARLRRDQTVVLAVDAYPDQTYRGRTYAVEASLDEKTRTALVRARVPNPEGRLRPGMFARVSLTLETRAAALTIPEEAIVPRGGQTFVFRVVDGKAVMTQVETGARQPGSVEIVKGLAAADRVVTDGHQKLQNGTAVMPAGEAARPPQGGPPGKPAGAPPGAPPADPAAGKPAAAPSGR